MAAAASQVSAVAVRRFRLALPTNPSRLQPETWFNIGAAAITMGAMLIRLALAAALPLISDETYYWEWSRRLALGYFDHPPGIAWLVHAGVELFGATSLGVRFFPVLAGGLGAYALCRLAQRLGGAAAGFRAAILFAAIPLFGILATVATPDVLYLAACCVALLAIDHALELPPDRRAWGWWAVAGGAFGLALWGKHNAVLLPIGVAAAFIVHPMLRRRLAEPGPYLAAAIGLLTFWPVLGWNAEQTWLSLRFQMEHGFEPRSGSSLGRLATFAGVQLLAVTPLLFVLLSGAVAVALRSRQEPRRFVLAMVAVTPILLFAISSLRRPVQANWPALAYLPALVLLASAPAAGSRRWLAAGCVSGSVLLGLAWLHFCSPLAHWPEHPDPLDKASGWDEVAACVIRHQQDCGTRGIQAWVAANNYHDASLLAFHLGPRSTVFSLNVWSRPNQYDLWPGFAECAKTGDALLMVLDEVGYELPVIAAHRPRFDKVEPGELLILRRGGRQVATRRLWRFLGWRPNPPAAASSGVAGSP